MKHTLTKSVIIALTVLAMTGAAEAREKNIAHTKVRTAVPGLEGR